MGTDLVFSDISLQATLLQSPYPWWMGILPPISWVPHLPDSSQKYCGHPDQLWEFKMVLRSQVPRSPSSSRFSGQVSHSSSQSASVSSGTNQHLPFVLLAAQNTSETLWTTLLKTLHRFGLGKLLLSLQLLQKWGGDSHLGNSSLHRNLSTFLLLTAISILELSKNHKMGISFENLHGKRAISYLW